MIFYRTIILEKQLSFYDTIVCLLLITKNCHIYDFVQWLSESSIDNFFFRWRVSNFFIDRWWLVRNRCPVSKRFAFRIGEMMDGRVIQCHCSTRESCRREERCERVKVGWQETNVKGTNVNEIKRGGFLTEKLTCKKLEKPICSRERIVEKDFPLMELISTQKCFFFFFFQLWTIFLHSSTSD